jgi:hypothetical protein
MGKIFESSYAFALPRAELTRKGIVSSKTSTRAIFHSISYILYSQRCVRCIQRIGEDRIKFDCERCAKRQFAELMPSALAGAVFSPVSSPGS